MPSFRIAEEVITYVRVAPPELDLVGVVLKAFSAAGFFVVVALVLGTILGVRLILKRRRAQEPSRVELDLHKP